jgi:hypothetical protein
VNKDNTVHLGSCILQIEKSHWRATLAGCRVTVYQYLDGAWSIGYGPHLVGRYNREGLPLQFERPQPLGQRESLRSSLCPRPQPKPDTSCAMKTGHFNLPTTAKWNYQAIQDDPDSTSWERQKRL